MTEEQARHLGVMIEKVADDVRTIAEGHIGLVQKMDRLEKKMDDGFASVNARLDAHAAQITGLRTDVNELKEDVKVLKEHAADMKPRMVRVERSLGLPAPRRKRKAVGRGRR